jgi:hypothetical protein
MTRPISRKEVNNMSITKLADRIVGKIIPTTEAAAICAPFRVAYYRCCAARFKHKAFLVDDICGRTQWGSCVNSTPECG